jgi:hypothetical protein
MRCPRCQHENRPQARFCEECASPLKPASPTVQAGADPNSEVESLRRALTESLEQQTATAEILRVCSRGWRWPAPSSSRSTPCRGSSHASSGRRRCG